MNPTGKNGVDTKSFLDVAPFTEPYPNEKKVRVPLWEAMLRAATKYNYNQEMSHLIHIFRARVPDRGKTIKRVKVKV